MIEEVQAHEMSTSMVKAALAEVDAGTDIALNVRVSCSSNCDLQGGKVRIADEDGAVVKEIELTEFSGTGNETDEFVVKAPIEPGGYTWIAVFPAEEKEGVIHEESSVPFSFTVKPHSTSIAVWDVPSHIASNDRFKIKVGVKCSAECRLMDKKIGIYGQKGKKVATGALGGVPWPGTSALYWAEVHLEAPGIEGYYRWTVKLPKPDLELPHDEASYHFGFTSVRPPEHVVTVEVIDKDTKTPIKNVLVLVHPYRGHTDERGMARLLVPKGEYDVYVWEREYTTFETAVKVAGDVAVKAELLFAPVPPDDDG